MLFDTGTQNNTERGDTPLPTTTPHARESQHACARATHTHGATTATPSHAHTIVLVSACQIAVPPGESGGRWTKDEDKRLKEGVKQVGAKNWMRISLEYLGGKRTDVQCLHRWQKV